MELMEKGVGLRKTKMGPGAKQEAYIVGRSNMQKFGICLLVVSFICIIVGLALKSDISYQRGRMIHQRERVSDHKQVLFNTKKVEFLSEKQEEAKLMKILTVLQQHLARDKKTKDYQEVFASAFKDAQKEHRDAITKALKKLKGNKKIVNYLKGKLFKLTSNLHAQTLTFAKRYQQIITSEAQESDQRLHLLTQAITTELSADVKEEKKYEKMEEKMAKVDPEWARLEAKAKAKGEKETQDEKDVETIIENFKDKVDGMKAPSITDIELSQAQSLLDKFDNDQITDVKKAQKQMLQIMQKSASGVTLDTSAADSGVVVEQFRNFVEQAAFTKSGEQAKVEKELKDWEKGKTSDAETMEEVEEEVENNKVDAEWLHEDESKRDEEKMLEVGQENHENAEEKDLEVPKPDVNPDTEEEAEEQKAENEVAAEEQTAKAGDAGGDAGK